MYLRADAVCRVLERAARSVTARFFGTTFRVSPSLYVTRLPILSPVHSALTLVFSLLEPV